MAYKLPLDPWLPITKSKSDEMLKKLKPKKVAARQKKAKRVKWKDVSKYGDKTEYEVYVSDRYIGTVRQEFNTKWKMYPDFDYEDLFYSHVQTHAEYYDFREAGKALVDFWVTSV
jgi:hypothetical protein